MPKTKLLLALAIVLSAFMATTAAPSSAFFKDLAKPATGHCESATKGVCGSNTLFTVSIGSLILTCPAGEALFELWQIEKADPNQERVPEGGHLLITLSCPVASAKIGGVESKAKLEPGCAVQLKQERGQTTEVKGRVDQLCKIVASAGLCKIEVPVIAANENLGNSTLENFEEKPKLLKFLKVTSNVKSITLTGNGACGFTKSAAGELKGGFSIFDVSWS